MAGAATSASCSPITSDNDVDVRMMGRSCNSENLFHDVLGPELICVTGLVKLVTAVARLVCPDLLG